MLHLVIPVFNRKEYTQKCLDSLKNQSYGDFKIIIVDDGSTDGTKEMLANDYPEVSCLAGNGNLWWTASVNMGIAYALKNGAQLVMTLNNDTVAPDDFIEKMINWSKKKPNALLGAYACDVNKKEPIYGGERFTWITSGSKSLLTELQEGQRKGLHEVDHFPGRGLLIPIKVFEKIGLFDDKQLPHYFADYDFTYRAHRKGFKIFCNYDSVLYIYPEESGDRKNRISKSFKNYYNHLFGIKGGGNLRNFTVFAFRNCPPYYLPPFLLIGYIRRLIGYFLR